MTMHANEDRLSPEDVDTLVVKLRTWTRNHDPHVAAAVELLVSYGHAPLQSMWLSRGDFVSRYVHDGPREATVAWRELSEDLEAGTAPGASETEVGVLRFAADLGTDRWRISRMGGGTWRLVCALAEATGTQLRGSDLETIRSLVGENEPRPCESGHYLANPAAEFGTCEWCGYFVGTEDDEGP